MSEPRPASECFACGKPATWQAFIVFRDLPPIRRGRCTIKPPDTRCPSPPYGACDEHQHHTDDVTAPEMLRKSWPKLIDMFHAVNVPVPDIEKTTVQWERVIALADSPALKGG